MKTYHHYDLNKYLQNDWVLDMLVESMSEQENNIRTNKWLLEMDNKRMIYADVYGDILKGDISESTSVLDVGGGVNALTKRLAKHSRYSLCDFLSHGGSQYLETIHEKYSIGWINNDWYEADFDNFDLIIANDIFPDVDMRLELFLDTMLKKCRELRIVLTYYNTPKFYQAKRIDDSEVLTFLSWDGEIVSLKLKKYLDRMMDTDLNQLESLIKETESIYRNGRQVSYLRLKGDNA